MCPSLMHMSLCTRMDTAMYVFSSLSLFCVCAHPSSPLRPQPCMCHLIPAECRAEPSDSSNPPPPSPETTKRAGVNWNEWATQCKLAWAKWKCQACHGSLLSVCRRARLTGEPEQNNTQPVIVNTSLFPFHVTPFLFSSMLKQKKEVQ